MHYNFYANKKYSNTEFYARQEIERNNYSNKCLNSTYPTFNTPGFNPFSRQFLFQNFDPSSLPVLETSSESLPRTAWALYSQQVFNVFMTRGNVYK